MPNHTPNPHHRGSPVHSKQQTSLMGTMLTRKEFIVAVGAIIFGSGLWFFVGRHIEHATKSSNAKPADPTAQAKKPVVGQVPSSQTFNKNQFSITDPASIWLVVNKHLPLTTKPYIPADLVFPNVPLRIPGNETMQLRKATATAFEALFASASAAGHSLMLASGYRSYNYQVSLYNSYVNSSGQAAADKESARPGYSEHQTGFAADVEPINRQQELQAGFGQLPEGIWVAQNAYKYGLLLRYPADKVSVTGYEYEPWHLRYIGVELSTEMHNNGIVTLEEFFNLGAAPSYLT